MKKRSPLLFSTALVLALLLTYWNSLSGDFLYDDEFLIQKNQVVQNISLLPKAFITSSTYGSGGTDSFYRPIQILSYGLIHHLFGLNPIAFHAFNLLLHMINTILIFFFSLSLLKRVQTNEPLLISFLTALVWGLHPIHTEAVSYISATADPLHFLFGLLFLLFSLSSKWSQKGLGLTFLTLALLSKEASVTFPGLLLAALLFNKWTSSKEVSTLSVFWQVLPSLLLSLLYAALRSGPLDFDQSFTFYSAENLYTNSILIRAYTGLAALSDYLQLWFWPSHLQIDREFGVYVQWSHFKVIIGILLCLLSLATFAQFRKRPLLVFIVLWFWAYHSLHTGVVLPLNSIFLEHWMYVPSFALSLGSFFAISMLTSKLHALSKPLLITLGMVWAVALSVKTFTQNKVWASPIRLYNHILEGSPNIARVHNNLAMAYSDRGERSLAEKHYLKSIEIQDIYPQVRHNLGLLYLREGKTDLGLSQLKRAIEIDPKFYPSYIYLEKAYESLGETRLKNYYQQKALEHRPDIQLQNSRPPSKK